LPCAGKSNRVLSRSSEQAASLPFSLCATALPLRKSFYKMPATDIYLAVFRSSHAGYEDNSCGKAYRALSGALKRGKWPYDMGDDPSFFYQQRSGFNLTWGICRQQVRNRIRPGDTVVFFSVRRRSKQHPFEYCLCAVGTVEKKVRQSDIWRDGELRKKFGHYLNLLIRPRGLRAWEHHEPGSEKPHKDWLWRIASQDGFRRKDCMRLEADGLLPEGAKIRGRPVSIAENYVIFSAQQDHTRILAKPPLVALCDSNGQPEKWLDDETSLAVRAQTLEVARTFGSRRDSLRSVHKQHSHPVTHWRMSSVEASRWRANLLQVLDEAQR